MISSDIESSINKVLEVLQPHLPLVNCHMVDFLSCDLWNLYISDDIRVEINQLGADKGFNCFKECNFEEINSESPLQQFLVKTKIVSSLGVSSLQDLCSSLDSIGGKEMLTVPQLNMFMSPKKAHEVEVLSRVVASLAQANNTGCIIDLGGGKGYLGSTLAYHYGLNVLSIDCAQVNTHGAVKLAGNLKKWWDTRSHSKSDKGSERLDKLYKQDTTFVSSETNLRELVCKHFKTDNGNEKNLRSLCLVGLHACGDLTPSCLRLFCENQDIKALCIVGCCYNLITEDEKEETSKCSGEPGFPMSFYLKKKRFNLGRNARMLAAQSMDRITEHGKPPPISLWYRALLQILLIERNENTDVKVGRSKISNQDFSEYVSKAMTKLNLPQASAEHVNAIQAKYQKWQKLHDIFFMMRVSLAPVIERLILLDRVLYLHEQGFKHTYLVQLFNSVISPRCCGIIAFKNDLNFLK